MKKNKSFLNSYFKGVFMMLGMISVLGLIFLVSAFVQPTVSPSDSNFYINPNSPISKILNLSIKINKTTLNIGENLTKINNSLTNSINSLKNNCIYNVTLTYTSGTSTFYCPKGYYFLDFSSIRCFCEDNSGHYNTLYEGAVYHNQTAGYCKRDNGNCEDYYYGKYICCK